MLFSEKLKKLRNDNHITQEELAEYLSVSRQAVSKYESGISCPDVKKIILLSQLFQVSTDYLLLDTVNNNMSDQNGTLNVVTFNRIITTVSKETKVSKEDILGRSREAKVVLILHICMLQMQ